MAQLATELEIAPVRSVPRREAPNVVLEGPLVLAMRPPAKLTEAQFLAFCQQNPDLRIERAAEGDLILMSPTMDDTDIKNAELTRQLANWAAPDGTGRAFGSSGGFKLPNGATRSPGAAWVRRGR